jgi:hypothetical protein
MNVESTALGQDELWGIIMKMADPSDILRTLLNAAGDRPASAKYPSACAIHKQTMILNGCTVVINQHVTRDQLVPQPPEDTLRGS